MMAGGKKGLILLTWRKSAAGSRGLEDNAWEVNLGPKKSITILPDCPENLDPYSLSFPFTVLPF